MTTREVQSDQLIAHLYFGARQTCLEMLKDRHYEVPVDLYLLSKENFVLRDKKSFFMDGIKEKYEGNIVPVFIIMSMDDKDNLYRTIGSWTGHTISTDSDLKHISDIHLILICDGTKKVSQLISDADFIGHRNVEIFDVRHMFINPTKHIYQPKWRIMSDKEITEMLQRYEANMTQTSRILLGAVCIDDPINRYYGGRPASKDRKGDVYEIIRDGVTVFYRKVVSKRMNVKPEKRVK